MTTYRYDLPELEQTRDGLRALQSAYEGAARRRGDVQDALGYPGLRDAVRGFTENWDHERGEQVTAIGGAGDMLAEICDGYIAFDRGSADTLYREGGHR